MYDNNWSANNLDQLRLKISSVIRNLNPEGIVYVRYNIITCMYNTNISIKNTKVQCILTYKLIACIVLKYM